MLDGQVKLFAAMLHEEKAVIAQHRIPDDTTETTQVRELLEHVDLDGAVVTADAANAQRDTAGYIAGNEEDGGRGLRVLPVRQGQPAETPARRLRRRPGGTAPATPITRNWTRATAGSSAAPSGSPAPENIDFPHVSQVARIRRDGYDADGTLISKEIVHAVTSLDAGPGQRRLTWRNSPAASGASNRCTGCATPHTAEDANTGYAGNGPQAMATLRNLAISLLYLSGVTEITRTLQAIARDRNRVLDYLPL